MKHSLNSSQKQLQVQHMHLTWQRKDFLLSVSTEQLKVLLKRLSVSSQMQRSCPPKHILVKICRQSLQVKYGEACARAKIHNCSPLWLKKMTFASRNWDQTQSKLLYNQSGNGTMQGLRYLSSYVHCLGFNSTSGRDIKCGWTALSKQNCCL